MTTISRSGLYVGRKAHWREPRVGSSLCVTDFLSVRDRRIAESEGGTTPVDIEFEVRRAAARRRRQAEVLGPIERFVYSLISASALTVVLIGVLALSDSTRQSSFERSGQITQGAGLNDGIYAGQSARIARPN
jgi:hypothetical protein